MLRARRDLVVPLLCGATLSMMVAAAGVTVMPMRYRGTTAARPESPSGGVYGYLVARVWSFGSETTHAFAFTRDSPPEQQGTGCIISLPTRDERPRRTPRPRRRSFAHVERYAPLFDEVVTYLIPRTPPTARLFEEIADLTRCPLTSRYTAGWPMPAFAGSSTYMPASGTSKSEDLLQIGFGDRTLCIPRRPAPVGLLVNLVMWAVTVRIVMMLLAMRGRLRRRRGRCPRCAYPIGVCAVCTECGTPLSGDVTRVSHSQQGQLAP